MIVRERKTGILNPFSFLIWSSVLLALAWFWGDELVRVHGWSMNKWFMNLPFLVRLIVRQAHWAFYFGFGLIFMVEYRRGRKKEAGAALLYLIANLVVAFVLVKLLKMSLGRPRPFMETHGALAWRPFSLDTHFQSLPSGHTADAFVGLGVIHRLYSSNWLRLSSLGVALLVGASRVALGKHYPSDVILGLMLGYLGGYWLAQVWRKEGFRPVIRGCARVLAGTALIALAVWAGNSAQAPAVQWSQAHGTAAAASPLLLPGQSLGQAIKPPAPRLSYLTLSFGTYLARADGRVELRLLAGTEPPPGGGGPGTPLPGPEGLPGGPAGRQRALPLGPSAPAARARAGALPGGLPGSRAGRIPAPLNLAGQLPGLARRPGPDPVHPGAGVPGPPAGPGAHLPGAGLRPPAPPGWFTSRRPTGGCICPGWSSWGYWSSA